MNSDFELGSKLYELQFGDSALEFPQCLEKLIDDLNLKAAFDNLSLDNVFPKYFDGTSIFDSGKKNEVNALVDAQLVAPLASKVKDILNGYSSSSVAAYQNISVEESIRSGEYDSSSITNPSLIEHATLFASPASALQNQSSIPSVETGDANVSKSKSPILFFLPIVLALVFVGGLGFALFKLEALCEPLGLCDDDLDEDSNNGEDLEKSGRIADPVPDNNQAESMRQSKPDQNLKGDLPVIPPPSKSKQSESDLLPDREEVLW